MSKLTVGFAWCVVLMLAGCGSDAQPSSGAGAANNGNAGSAGVSGGAGAPASLAGAGGGSSAGVAGSSAGAAANSGGTSGAGGVGGAKVACTAPADGVTPPADQLIDTGCVDPTDPRKPVASAVTYELNSPLWSDSADKQRAFVLPAGKKIHVRNCSTTPADCPMGTADDGRWDFPIGTVMIKIFMFDSKLVETRLFMHTPSTATTPTGDWVGYSYMWNEAQTAATLVSSDRQQVMFNTGTRTVSWHYPSRQDCLDCHTPQSGSTLGPETAQLTRMVGGVDQIQKFVGLGLFESTPAAKTAYVSPTGTDGTTEQRARSYLHANCAFCHRPDGVYKNFDLRYDIALKDTKACNTDGVKGAVGTSQSIKLLKPADATNSLMWERMDQASPDDGRMPQIGSYAIDDAVQKLVSTWINALPTTACN